MGGILASVIFGWYVAGIFYSYNSEFFGFWFFPILFGRLEQLERIGLKKYLPVFSPTIRFYLQLLRFCLFF